MCICVDAEGRTRTHARVIPNCQKDDGGGGNFPCEPGHPKRFAAAEAPHIVNCEPEALIDL